MGSIYIGGTIIPEIAWRLLPLALVQVGGGEVCGLTTGAKALFCFTADTILAGEKENMPEALLQFEGRLVEEAIVGLDGTMAYGELAADPLRKPGELPRLDIPALPYPFILVVTEL